MKASIQSDLMNLMLVPGLSGHEDRVRRALQKSLYELGIDTNTDRLGNLHAHFPGDGPRVMLFTHMDQLGFVVRKIEANGLLRLERLGGVPERALAAQEVLICVAEGRDVPGIIANKSHHATAPNEKYTVTPYAELYVDTGHNSAKAVETAGIHIGQPVVYAPFAKELADNKITGTSVDDRAGCAVLLALARCLQKRRSGPPMATDTPDMETRGDMVLGGGPGMSLYSFHGRGTLNGVIPHPAMVSLFETTAAELNIPLQRSAQTGVLTDLSYVQLTGQGVASIDVGFPMRASHSAREVCDLNDLLQLTQMLDAALNKLNPDYSLNRDDYT